MCPLEVLVRTNKRSELSETVCRMAGTKISMKQIKYVENWINIRLMKVLGYLISNEKFEQLSVPLAS